MLNDLMLNDFGLCFIQAGMIEEGKAKLIDNINIKKYESTFGYFLSLYPKYFTMEY